MESPTPTLRQQALDLAEFESDPTVRNRGATYEPKIGADYQCPYCWVLDGVHTALVTVASKTDDDRWRCKVRHGDIDAAP